MHKTLILCNWEVDNFIEKSFEQKIDYLKLMAPVLSMFTLLISLDPDLYTGIYQDGYTRLISKSKYREFLHDLKRVYNFDFNVIDRPLQEVIT